MGGLHAQQSDTLRDLGTLVCQKKKKEKKKKSKAISTIGLLPLQYILPGFSALSINLINYTFTIIKL